MIKVLIGEIFNSKANVLVNTINCVGVMGKGIALEFKKKYPKMFIEYVSKCNKGYIEPGHIYPYYEDNNLKLINFATKEHWRNLSKISYVESCLNQFVNEYKKLEITSIAFPPLGCGNGGLDWAVVGPLMYQTLSKLDIDYIEIYAPHGTNTKLISEEFLNRNINLKNTYYSKNNYNDNWLLALHMVNELNNSQYKVSVGRTIFQKIFYIMNRFGIDMNLMFTKSTYGPFSPDVNKIISYLSNNNYLVEKGKGKMIEIVPTNKYKYDNSKYGSETRRKFDEAFSLLSIIRNTNDAEVVSTIIFSFDQLNKNNNKVTEKQLIDYICDWKKRFNDEKCIDEIIEVSRYLTCTNVINISYDNAI